MRSLVELALKYRCDKLLRHSYMPWYEQAFQGLMVERLLEIGIGTAQCMEPFVKGYKPGASLRMWSEYFPDAQIYGCDIDNGVLFQEGNIHCCVCDQGNMDSLRAMVVWAGMDLDVVIDDGSHQLQDQITAGKFLRKYVREGGLYVVEDVQQPKELAEALGGEVFQFDRSFDDVLVVVRC